MDRLDHMSETSLLQAQKRQGPYPMEHIKHVDQPTTAVTEAIQRIDMRDNAYGLAGRGEYGPAVQKGVRNSLPGKYPLSAIDYASGWREGAPGRVLVPELKRRFPETIAVEVSDRTSAGEMELIRALARRSDAVVVATQVRIASYSGRMDLSADQKALLEELASDVGRPFVVVALGNPYVATLAARLPAFLLTYEFGDATEAAAVRALCGEAPIGGKLPISIPDLFPAGHGLVRAAVRPGLPVAASVER